MTGLVIATPGVKPPILSSSSWVRSSTLGAGVDAQSIRSSITLVLRALSAAGIPGSRR